MSKFPIVLTVYNRPYHVECTLDSLLQCDGLSKFLREKTMILISHNENVLKICDSIIKISNGKITFKENILNI